jgi:hypothetical protein
MTTSDDSASVRALRNDLAHAQARVDKLKKALAALDEDGDAIHLADVEPQTPIGKKGAKGRKASKQPKAKGALKGNHSGLTPAIVEALKVQAKAVPASAIKPDLMARFGTKNFNSRLYLALQRLEEKGTIAKIKNVDGILWKIK